MSDCGLQILWWGEALSLFPSFGALAQHLLHILTRDLPNPLRGILLQCFLHSHVQYWLVPQTLLHALEGTLQHDALRGLLQEPATGQRVLVCRQDLQQSLRLRLKGGICGQTLKKKKACTFYLCSKARKILPCLQVRTQWESSGWTE